MPTHTIPLAELRDDGRVLISMAFSKKEVEDRKEWLQNFTVRLRTSFNRIVADLIPRVLIRRTDWVPTVPRRLRNIRS
jgi:hypothetical protein